MNYQNIKTTSVTLDAPAGATIRKTILEAINYATDQNLKTVLMFNGLEYHIEPSELVEIIHAQHAVPIPEVPIVQNS